MNYTVIGGALVLVGGLLTTWVGARQHRRTELRRAAGRIQRIFRGSGIEGAENLADREEDRLDKGVVLGVLVGGALTALGGLLVLADQIGLLAE